MLGNTQLWTGLIQHSFPALGALLGGKNKKRKNAEAEPICVQIDGNVELLSPIVLLAEHWGEIGTMHGNAMEGM